MPKTPIDYSNTVYYRLVCKDPTVKECYVGCTTNFSKRKSQHRTACMCPGSTGHHLYVYQFIRKNGNFDNWDMVPIETASFNNAFEARARERYWLEHYGAKLNKLIPGNTTEAELRYIEKHKEKMNEKVECPCGGKYTIQNKAVHFRTERHREYEERQQQEQENMTVNV